MSRTCLFDACSLLAYLNDEEGADKVEQLLNDEGTEKVIHAINLLEVYYDVYRVEGKERAEDVLDALEQFPARIIQEIGNQTFREAGRLKATYRLSIADAIAVGEARVQNADLVSADHHELDALEAAGEVEVIWIR
ncbi:MAG: type II toxin-antitoxin system VapC family toxin [Bacteroidota bacterium]